MTEKDRLFIDTVNAYAEKVLMDIDPINTPVSIQLQRLRPVLEAAAHEDGVSLEDTFIRYMDLATQAALERDEKFREDYKEIL